MKLNTWKTLLKSLSVGGSLLFLTQCKGSQVNSHRLSADSKQADMFSLEIDEKELHLQTEAKIISNFELKEISVVEQSKEIVSTDPGAKAKDKDSPPPTPANPSDQLPQIKLIKPVFALSVANVKFSPEQDEEYNCKSQTAQIGNISLECTKEASEADFGPTGKDDPRTKDDPKSLVEACKQVPHTVYISFCQCMHDSKKFATTVEGIKALAEPCKIAHDSAIKKECENVPYSVFRTFSSVCECQYDPKKFAKTVKEIKSMAPICFDAFERAPKTGKNSSTSSGSQNKCECKRNGQRCEKIVDGKVIDYLTLLASETCDPGLKGGYLNLCNQPKISCAKASK